MSSKPGTHGLQSGLDIPEIVWSFLGEDVMGVLILLVFGGIPIAVGAYLIWRIEKTLPVGKLAPLRDERGNLVPGDDRKPLYIDEEGKIFGYERVKSFVKKNERVSACKWFLLGVMIALMRDGKRKR